MSTSDMNHMSHMICAISCRPYGIAYSLKPGVHLFRNHILLQGPIRLGNGCLKCLVFIVSLIYLQSNWSDVYGYSNNDNEIHLIVGHDLYVLLASSIGIDFHI